MLNCVKNSVIFQNMLYVCFGIYWVTTILFVAPDNFVSISLLKYKLHFETYFYQQWGFFAPPPKYNDRLYYYFINDANKESVLRYEVIQDLQALKSKRAPFNGTEDVLDYILSSSLHAINDGLVAVKESLEFEYNNRSTEDLKDSITIEEGKKFIQNIKSFKTLHEYGQMVASKNAIPKEFDKVVIEVSHIQMPSFSSRFDIVKDSTKVELVIFRSDTILLFQQ